MARRPDPVEWPEDEALLGQVPHGAPLTVAGRLQAGYRDASAYQRPNVYGIKAMHIVVASSTLLGGDGARWDSVAAACSPGRIALVDDLGGNASSFPPNARCTRPGCAQLFALADKIEENPT